MENIITLQKYAERNNITVEELVKLAKSKSIVIPSIPNHIINESVIKLLHPVFDLSKQESRKRNSTGSSQQASLYAEENKGKIFDGKIDIVLQHGAYVDFDGQRGFISISDVDWVYIRDIHSILTRNKEVQVIVLGTKGKKILLGRKQLLHDPLNDIASRLERGTVVEGIVRKVSKSIAYIDICDGICGEHQLAEGQKVLTGSKVTCAIDTVDVNNHHLIVVLLEILEEPKSTRIKKKAIFKELIGVIKFFSRERDFGYVLYCNPQKDNPRNNLLECRLNASDWQDESIPDKGNWILFKPKKEPHGWKATHAKPFIFDRQGLLIAMNYRSKDAYINGCDRQGDTHNINVLCHTISELRKSNSNWEDIIVSSFSEYLSPNSDEQVNKIIQEFLSDDKLCKVLIIMLPKLKAYQEEKATFNSVIGTLSDAVEKSIFSKKDVDILSVLPSDFDYNLYAEKIIEILEKSVKTNGYKVNQWLQSHSDLINTSFLEDYNLSIDLAYMLYQNKKDLSIMDKTGLEWKDIYTWLKEKSASCAKDYVLSYFANKEENYINQFHIVDLVDEKNMTDIIKECLSNSETHSALLHVLATHYANKNIDIISDYIETGIDISHVYAELGSYLNSKVMEEEVLVRHFFTTCSSNDISLVDIINSAGNICDEMRVELFVQTGDIEYLNTVHNFDNVPIWLNKQQSDFVLLFLQKGQEVFVDEEDKNAIADTINAIDKEVFKDAILNLNEDEKYKLLQLCPEEYAKNIVCNYFTSTKLFELYIGEQWNKLKAGIRYVAFDLESDGNNIKEFAFRSENNTKVYQGEEQLGTLLRALKRTDIIVGHRIKEWDLGKVLSKKGFKSDAFVWDTLEIEILLNPCRYSYALHTQHTAEEDTELVDELFWNQLFRLSQDEKLCKELSNFLPSKITAILESLRQPMFIGFFSESSARSDGFYQVLIDTDMKIIDQLDEINLKSESTLIVAPKRLWSRISEHVSLSYVQLQDDIDYLSISIDELFKTPIKDVFVNAVLNRFVTLSKTPIVANLANYIRLNYLDDNLLSNYTERAGGHIACADMDIIQDETVISQYEKIYFIGCEIENRLNQYKLETLYSPADFWNEKENLDRGSIPMRLGASSFIAVSSEERKLDIFKDVPTDAANVWIERLLNGKYCVNYNYDFYSKLKAIEKNKNGKIDIYTIPWTIENTDYKSIVLIHSDRRTNRFDAQPKRVSATSRYRAAYWIYQFALLSRIHESKGSRPIIFFLDNTLEIEKVEKYARKCGFYIPTEGTLVRKLELIEHNTNGMLVVCNEQFFEIVDWRKDTPYCYVWDHLAVDKHMMMWHGFTDERNKSFLQDGVESDEENLNIGGTNDTYQAALLSTWPIYAYYYRFIRANSIESSMYILDSYLEEYHGLASEWGVSSCSFQGLWHNEDDYTLVLDEARKVFAEKTQVSRTDMDDANAMDIILATLIKSEELPNPQWNKVQLEILPKILKKESDYLVSLPTGGGKSVLFQGPALYNSAFSNKLSIVITPLKALMQDQVMGLGQKGFMTNVDYLNGDRSYQEVRSIYRKINGGEIAILYVTPERFRSRAFLNALSTRMSNDDGLEYFVFDEAHCISQWGMEFRPEYLNVIKKCKEIKKAYPSMCVSMFSATVTDLIYNQINAIIPVIILGQDNDKIIYNPIRSHIGMSHKLVLHDTQHRLQEVVNYIKDNHIDSKRSRMLVFCKTRNQCEEMALLLADKLAKEGVLNHNIAQQCIGYFHAGMDGDDREDMYNRFKSENDPLYILCATKAFGMGMDIPNIHYIVHLMPPSVLEDYLQEVGRAGRNKAMYQAVGFSIDNPIPTLCLCSKDDIKKAKEQLLQSTLSWKNLEEIRTAINDYITKIQPLEKTNTYPIVVPNTLWASSQFDHNFTNFKIGQYWLERMGRIKMGYLSPVHINIRLSDVTQKKLNEKLGRLSNSKKGHSASKILPELRKYQKKQNSEMMQVSVQELASKLSMHSTKLIDCLLWCEKHSIIRIEEKTRCRIAFTRQSEVKHMLEGTQHDLAFHLILKATRDLLRNNGVKTEKSYTLTDVSRLIKKNAENLQNMVKSVDKFDELGNKQTEKYMVWYDENDKNKNKGLSLAKSYLNDLYKKRIRQVFALLEMIPGVKVQSYLDTKKKAILQSVIVENNSWKEWMDSFQKDCVRVLTYIYHQSQSILRWAEMVTELNLEERSFTYFESILRYLNGMAYIASDSLLPTGIEVYATKQSDIQILENTEKSSDDYPHKQDFEEAMEIRNLRLCVMDVLTTKINRKQEFQELVSSYFSITDVASFMELLSKYYDEADPIWESIRAIAIKTEEERLKDNKEQWAIYNENSNENINVEAGPGSGKTHVLTLKCAKLIYHQHVNPQSILVLAYNRAVVVELKNRLTKLFASLGLSRSASQLHVYTFHSLAKRVCGKAALEGHEMNEWEKILFDTIKNKPNDIRSSMPELQYVFIDEFQDITQTRLDAIFGLRDIFSPLTFFTIGDKDQSIYGFEKEGSMDPNFYYNKLDKKLNPKKMTMNTNYRSYPKILEAASQFLPSTSHMPVPCKKNIDAAPQEKYVFIYQNQEKWSDNFKERIFQLKQQKINDLAVFFRTNNEVYHGYSVIKALNLKGIRIRIQGTSSAELFRMREIYAVLKILDDNNNKKIQLEDQQTEIVIKNKISSWIKQCPKWDIFYMDFAFVLVLDYLDLAKSNEELLTYGDMATSIRETLKEDNPQLYKLYDDKRFVNRRILTDLKMNIILTTMHKVKGLEFDAVMITPSIASLPFNPTEETPLNTPISNTDKEQIEEEQRLLYVAYTRARKYLFVYKGDRELAVEQTARFSSLENQWGIRERKVGLDNYNIGYNASYNFRNNKFIAYNVRKNDSISISKFKGIYNGGKPFSTFNIIHNGTIVGQLSSKSSIAHKMKVDGIDRLNGYFVSDVFYWTYEDTLAADKRAEIENGFNLGFASKWRQEAKDQGYIFIVDIAGYGI